MPDGFSDDHEVARLLGADFRVWSDPSVDWNAYDRVVVRSTWDYSTRRAEFVAWAHRVGPERLINPPALIETFSDKRYLATLDVPTVPTAFVAPGDVVPALDGEVVVKPTVSAGGRDTGRFGAAHHDAARSLITAIHDSGRTAMVQPYLQHVDSAGETALVFLGGRLSHVLHKKAVLRPDEVAPLADGDGPVAAAAMYDPELVTAADASAAQVALGREVVEQISRNIGPSGYVRVDLVPGPDGSPVVLEVEAVEPCLYLATAPGSAIRLAEIIRSWTS